MAFVAPENQGFVAPENQETKPFVAPENQGFVAPENQGPTRQLPSEPYKGSIPYSGPENMATYPPQGVTTLAPSLDVATLPAQLKGGYEAAKLGATVIRHPVQTYEALKALPSALRTAWENLGLSAEEIAAKGKTMEDLAPKQLSLPPGPTPVEGPVSLQPAVKINGKVFSSADVHMTNTDLVREQNQVMQKVLKSGGTSDDAIKAVDQFAADIKSPVNKGFVDTRTGEFHHLDDPALLKKISSESESPFRGTSFTMKQGTELTGGVSPNVVEHPNWVARDLETKPQTEAFSAEGKLLSPEAKQRLATLKEAADKGQISDVAPEEAAAPRSFLNINAQQGKTTGPLTDISAAAREANLTARAAASADKRGILRYGLKPEGKLSERLFDYVDQGRKPEILADLSAADKTKVLQTDAFMKTRYDQLLDQVNQIRKAKGLDLIKNRPNYVTHGNELSLADRFGLLTTSSEKKIAEVAADHAKVAQGTSPIWQKFHKVIFNHVARKEDQDFAHDAIAAFTRYSGSANRYIHMTPIVDELAEAAKVLKATHPNLSVNIEALASHLTGHMTPIDMAVLADQGVNHDVLAVVKQLNRQYIEGVLELNPSVSLAQTLRAVPIFAEENPFSIPGLKAFMRQWLPEDRAFALEHSQLLRAQVQARAERTIGEGTLKNISNWLPQALDREIGIWAFNHAYFESVGRLGERLAVKHADTLVGQLMPILTPVDTPAMLRGQTAKLIYPIMQEATVWSNYMVRRVLADATKSPEQAARLARAVVTGAAVNAGIALSAIRHPDIVKNLLPFLFPSAIGGPVGASTLRGLTELDKGNIGSGVGKLAETAFVAGLGPAKYIPGRLQVAKGIKYLAKE